MGEFKTEEEIVQTGIDLLIKALGTMVIEPEYRTNPENIGQKEFLGPVQRPILVAGNRKLVEDKLMELVTKLG